MLFGGGQAYGAGVTGFRKPLRAEFYDFATKERAAEKEIAALAKQYPHLKQRFAEIARQELARKWHRVQDILWLIQEEVRQAKPKAIKTKPQRPKASPQSD
jgi:hypothetical protein